MQALIRTDFQREDIIRLHMFMDGDRMVQQVKEGYLEPDKQFSPQVEGENQVWQIVL